MREGGAIEITLLDNQYACHHLSIIPALTGQYLGVAAELL